MKKIEGWILLITVCLVCIGVILSSQISTRGEYLSSLEAQSEGNLLVLWKNNQDRLASLQEALNEQRSQHEELARQTREGRVSIEGYVRDINRVRVFNGDAVTTGSGIEIRIDGTMPLMARDLLDLINELNNSGAEAIAINGRRITSRTFIDQRPSDAGYTLSVENRILTYPVSIQAIGDYQSIHGGLTMIGGVIDRLNRLQIRPTLVRRQELVFPRSPDQDHYRAVEIPA